MSDHAVTVTSAPALTMQQPERVPADQMPLTVLKYETPDEIAARTARYLRGGRTGSGKIV